MATPTEDLNDGIIPEGLIYELEALDSLFLGDFRAETSVGEDLPGIWGFEAAPGFEALSSQPHQQEWIVTFYCEAPGHWHPMEEGKERLKFERPLWMAMPAYARWIANQFHLHLLMARKIKSARPKENRLAVMTKHCSVLRSLAGLRSEFVDHEDRARDRGLDIANDQYAPGEDLFDAYRYDMTPLYATEPKFGGLQRQLQRDGSYLWLCEDHLK